MKCHCCEKMVFLEKTTIKIVTLELDKEYILCNGCSSVIERLIDHVCKREKIKDDSGE